MIELRTEQRAFWLSCSPSDVKAASILVWGSSVNSPSHMWPGKSRCVNTWKAQGRTWKTYRLRWDVRHLPSELELKLLESLPRFELSMVLAYLVWTFIFGLVITVILSLKMDWNRKVWPHSGREALSKAFLFLSCLLAVVQPLTASKFALYVGAGIRQRQSFSAAHRSFCVFSLSSFLLSLPASTRVCVECWPWAAGMPSVFRRRLKELKFQKKKNRAMEMKP